MSQTLNYLRMHRKRSPLTQGGVAFLIESNDTSVISSCEKGNRSANIEFLIIYHHLFAVSIESFYEPQSDLILPNLLKTMELLIHKLKLEKKKEIRWKNSNFRQGLMIES